MDVPALNGVRSDAWNRFVASLEPSLEAWRDGIGYDLAALAGMSELERDAIRAMIAARLVNTGRAADWRDLEAAEALELTEAIARRADDANPSIRLRAKQALGDADAMVAELCETIANSSDPDAVSEALDYVADHPAAAVREAVITRVRKLDSQFIWASMVMLEVFGGTEDAFAERPFLFQVQAQGAQGELMEQLIARVLPRA